MARKGLVWLGGALVLLVIYSASGTVGKLAGHSAVDQFRDGRDSAILDGTLKEVAKQMSAQLPMRMDEITTMTNVIALNNTLMYVYGLDLMNSEIDANSFRSGMRQHLLNGVCSQTEMVTALEGGAEFRYKYLSQDNFEVMTFAVDSGDC